MTRISLIKDCCKTQLASRPNGCKQPRHNLRRILRAEKRRTSSKNRSRKAAESTGRKTTELPALPVGGCFPFLWRRFPSSASDNGLRRQGIPTPANPVFLFWLPTSQPLAVCSSRPAFSECAATCVNAPSKCRETLPARGCSSARG